MTLNAIHKALAQLAAKQRSLEAEMQLTADLALEFHPWKKNLGKFVRQTGRAFPLPGLWKVVGLACTTAKHGQLVFQVELQQHSEKLRRPLAKVDRLAVSHLVGLEVLP